MEVNKKHLSEILGVRDRTIQNWQEQGMRLSAAVARITRFSLNLLPRSNGLSSATQQ